MDLQRALTSFEEMDCPPGSEQYFGPQVDPRCSPFDFTLLFEDIFFVGLPAVLFLILAPIQIWGLFRRRAAFSVRSRAIRRWKAVAFSAILVVQVVYLVYRAQYAELQTRVSLPADILSSTATVAAFFLSRASHGRSLRPSTVLDLYLSLSSLLNIARTRTLWLLAAGSPVPILMTVNLSLTLFALLLESIEERKRLSNGSPEEFSGIWSRISFSWLLPLLKTGYDKVLSQDDLPNLDTRLQSRLLRRQLITTWSKYDPKARHSLVKACFRTHLSTLPSAVIPRLCVTAFTFAQPFLVETTIGFVGDENAKSYHGRGLIGAWALVYLGIAFSRSLYKYETSRFIAKLRGGLIALVYQRSLNIRTADEGDISAVTLMGTDIERIAMFIAITSQISVATQNAQVAWIEKVQERLRATTTLLGDIKAIKMLALPQVVSTLLTNLRTNEIKTSKTFRKLLVATLMLSLTPLNLAPAATFGVYVVISVYWTHGSLLTAQAFTSLALIGLLTGPVIAFIQSLPQVLQCVGSFDRIQQYCSYADVDLKDENYYEPGRVDLRDESEIHLLAPDSPPEPFDTPRGDTISLHSRGFKWSKNGPTILKDLELDISREAITVITGPVGSARAIYAKKPIVLLDDVFSSMDAHTIDVVSSRLFGPVGLLRRQRATVILSTHHRKLMALSDIIIILEEGKVAAKDTPASLLQSNGYVNKLGIQLTTNGDVTEVVESSKLPTAEEVFDIAADVAINISEETDGKHVDIRRKKGELSVYAYYLASSGWYFVVLYSAAVTGWIFCIEFSNVWMKWWSAANASEPDKDIWMYLGIYALLGILGTLSGCICAWAAFIYIISRSAAQLHSNLLQATLRAPFYSRSTRDLGELLNRFSRDMELIDMELPSNMVNYTSTKVVIIAIFTRYLGVTIPFFAIYLYFLQSFYLQTSRQIRLLAIEAHAPLFTHFSESIAGAVTIRAFGWQSYHQERNYRLIDASQRPVYLQSCIQHWLSFVLEMMTTVLAVLLVSTVLIWKDRFSPGSVGVSLVTVIGFSEVLVRLVQTWTTLEPSIGAVSRVKRFAEETETEERKEKGAYVPATWPQAGDVEFAGWTTSYGTTADSKPVLIGVSLSIKAGQHVAICGRTGSGKTSLILSLLQMTEIVEGSISIDGVDLSTLTCAEVRSRINVVPQDPFLMPGTIRFNMDPLNGASDEDIIHALDQVRLRTIVDEQGGIDKEIDLSSWSSGQKQLLCFARAMLKKSRILILDEAMSSVDHETETIMQEIIDTQFKECTVLAVMHRLEHIRRYDKAAVFGDGKLLEFGAPGTLLSGDTNLARLYSFYQG
ncbi:hypothetical protein THARTR1_10684 [Trichoderma harzianum]|uniref:ABC transporter n=1 Tax=Trichoderma harzianum TaxID=5544 RepID=A0A2K0TNT9_TRIHA|nr:hypothetical protein THARTR1_10684 [Trichoderma harzianum]